MCTVQHARLVEDGGGSSLVEFTETRGMVCYQAILGGAALLLMLTSDNFPSRSLVLRARRFCLGAESLLGCLGTASDRVSGSKM